MAGRDPLSFSQWAMFAALLANRPLEALSYRKYRDVPSYFNTGARRGAGLHLALGNAFHILGRYREELDLGLETEREFPEDPPSWLTMQIQARAALGEVHEVERLVAKSEGLRAEGAGSSRALIAGLELAAHGHPKEARGMFQRALSWVRSTAAQQSTTSEQLRRDSIDVLYYCEEYEAALAASQSWLARDSLNWEAILDVGQSAARLGDRATALRMEARLASVHRPNLRGADTWGRATIISDLGDQARAVALLRQAYHEGSAFDHTIHRDPELSRLRGYPPFEEWIRPKG
jgi:tetratricopeptide (TPR) repeat protein